MIGRMPAPFARATASLASSRGGSIMPIKPRKTRSARRPHRMLRAPKRVLRERAEGDPERAQRLAGQFLVGRQDLGAPRLGQRSRLLAHEFVRAARQQNVRRALGEDEQDAPGARRRCASCSSACARTRTAPRRRARSGASSASSSSPALRAATISAPSVGSPCTVQRPSCSCSTALLARSATVSARINSNRSGAINRPPPSRLHFAFRSVAGAAERRRARSRSRPRARSSRSS